LNDKTKIMTTEKDLQKIVDGKPVSLYTLFNKKGMSVDISNFGAKVIRLLVPDKSGIFDDVVLGFDTLDEYLVKEEYFGAVCGRVANRIKDGKFTLDGVDYQLPVNNSSNHLHGGVKGFNKQVWDIKSISEQKIVLNYISKDGEEGYPGILNVTVTYELSDENELKLHYEATTSKPTIVGFCHHSYFNLKGAGNGTVYDHVLQINADFYTILDESGAPTGEIRSVENTPFDFREPTLVGDRIDDKEYAPGRGLDNNWTIRKHQVGELVLAGSVYEPESGRKMEVLTTQPGLQVYSGNWIENQIGKDGKTYDFQTAICLEAQGFPNAPNVAHFPSAVVRPNRKYDEWCIYKFSVE